MVENDIVKNIENWLWEELFKSEVLKRNNWWYNIIYLNVLLSCMKDIMELAKPIIQEEALSPLQVKVIKLQILNKIESIKSLNYLEYLLDWYISRLESSKDSLKIANSAIEKARKQY